MNPTSDLGVWVAAILSVAYLSASAKDTIFSRIAFETVVGAGIGHYLLSALITIEHSILTPAVGGDVTAILILILGIMLLLRLWPRYSWVSKYPSSVFFGVGAGVTVAGAVTSMILAQITGSVFDFPALLASPVDFIGALVLVGGMLCILSYFIFTVQRKGWLRFPQNAGRILLMYLFASYTNSWCIGGLQLVAEQIIFDTLGFAR
jgi:hypothetical protein